MNRFLKIFMLFFVCFYVGNAQENAKNHKVNRGETIIDIAKRYNVTPYDIQQANLESLKSLDEIKEDDVLIIPESKIKSPQLKSAADAIKTSISTNSITYKVKKGETKFGLSKRFGLTITELETFNPQIVTGLNEGHVLKINPRGQNISEESTSEIQTETSITFDGYKDHLVLKGETLWGISKTNGLTVEQLVGINTDVLSGVLREGQTLKIPHSKQDGTASFKNYTVNPGDTKYGLSKRFKTTIEVLERLNPQIIKMLHAGHVLKIPINDSLTVSTVSNPTTSLVEKSPSAENPTIITNKNAIAPNATAEKTETTRDIPNTSEKSQVTKATISNTRENEMEPISSHKQNAKPVTYDSYEIKPKETLYSLSQKAGMSISDLVVLNPQLEEYVQIGTIIKMPSNPSETTQESINPTPQVTGKSVRYTDLSKTLNTVINKKLLFFLPFTDDAFNKETADNKTFNSVLDTFKKSHLEFYSGAKMAVDSIKKLGLNVQVDILEIENDKRDSKAPNLLTVKTITNYDAHIVPFYETIEEEVAALVTNQNIPVITAVTIAHQQNTNNLYSALPSINQQRIKLLDYMISKQGNIIVLNDVNRAESKGFIAEYVPYAKFVDIKKNGTFNEDDLLKMMNKDKLNFVILNSERNSVFLNATNTLLSELNAYDLQLSVLESSLIPDSDDISFKRFRILKMLFPSLTPAKLNSEIETFSKKYQSIYDRQPTTNALLGFDITFDTLLRLSQQNSFEASAKNDVTEYMKLKFNYQINTLGGYSNEGIYILQHDTDLDLQEVN